jgi:hypothetical protein
LAILSHFFSTGGIYGKDAINCPKSEKYPKKWAKMGQNRPKWAKNAVK